MLLQYIPQEQRERYRYIKSRINDLVQGYVEILGDKDPEHQFSNENKTQDILGELHKLEAELKVMEAEPQRIIEDQRKRASQERLVEEEKTKRRYKTVIKLGPKLEDYARRHFPVTDDPLLAGYMLRDGDMLAFSYNGTQRDVDHRYINTAFPPKTDIDGGTDGMKQFMLATGAIRMIISQDGRSSFDVDTKPTRVQVSKILEIVKNRDETVINFKGDERYFSRYEIEDMSEFLGYQYIG